MGEMIIASLSEELLEETAGFISSCQNHEESFVAWLGFSAEEIISQLLTLSLPYKESCLVAIQNGEVSGFLGVFVSEQQSTFRLLGPFIAANLDWQQTAHNLFDVLREKIPNYLQTAKVAFYGENVNCKKFYETSHFELYNAERTLMFSRDSLGNLAKFGNAQIKLRSYKSSDYDQFVQIHPSGAYFTATEVISLLNENHQLIVAELEESVVGYVYFEIFPADQYTEICFLNVASVFRSNGIGSLLLSRAILEAFEKDWVNNIQISVRVDNKEADKLYLRIGFIQKNVVLALQRDLNQYPLGSLGAWVLEA